METHKPRRRPLRPPRTLLLWQLLIVVAVLAFLIGLAIGTAFKAHACDPGSYYHPENQACESFPDPYAPSYRQPQTNRPYAPNTPRYGQ